MSSIFTSHVRLSPSIQYTNSHKIILFLLILVGHSTVSGSEVNVNDRGTVFAPYIAAHAQWESDRASSATGKTVSDGNGNGIDDETGMTEDMMRSKMLSKPSNGNDSHKLKAKPYAQGHTFIPTVNVKTVANKTKQVGRKESTLNKSNTSSLKAPPTGIPITSSSERKESTVRNINNAHVVDGMSETKEEMKKTGEILMKEDMRILQRGTMKGSVAVPIVGIGAVVWLISSIMKQNGMLAKGWNVRKVRQIRKRLSSPRLMA